MFDCIVFSAAFAPRCSQNTDTAFDDWTSLLHFRFINARRRIVQPMIDQSNRAGKFQLVSVFIFHRHKSSSSYTPGVSSPGNKCFPQEFWEILLLMSPEFHSRKQLH